MSGTWRGHHTLLGSINMDMIKLLPLIIGVAVVLVVVGVVARRSTSGAADALIVAPRARALFEGVIASAGQVSAAELAMGKQVERDLLALDRQVADRRLRRHVQSVLQDVAAVSVDAPAPLAIRDLYRASVGAARPRAELLRDEANRGLRAVDDVEARAELLVRLGKTVGQ